MQGEGGDVRAAVGVRRVRAPPDAPPGRGSGAAGLQVLLPAVAAMVISMISDVPS